VEILKSIIPTEDPSKGAIYQVIPSTGFPMILALIIDYAYKLFNLTLFGKINFGLGISFFILGKFLFVQEFNLSLSFICLGIALFFASFLTTKERPLD
jgi:4-hydroxybenzoate polyprenyltransferase